MNRTRTSSGFRRLGGIFLDTFFAKNIVLVQAVGLCPIIAIGINLKYGVALTLCTAAVLLPTSLCMSLWGSRLPAWLRPPVYTVGASILLLGAAALVNQYLSHELYAALYLYLPLMAGFGLAICVVSALREMAASGTLWDIPLGFTLQLPEAVEPFAGFILLGFMAAFLKWVKAGAARAAQRKEAGR